MNIPEILSPAGSMEALYAAIHAKTDAAYFGGKVLSARAYAGNFNNAEIIEATRLLHQNKAKAYITINTLVKNHELKFLTEIGETLSKAQVDAVIIQDMGIYLFFKKYFPNLNLHASTQMTVHSIAGAKMLYDMGFERVVLSRELTLNEVVEIMRAVPIQVETFVHGALCYCYSGQCQMSAAYGERSANRGKCAQPCRLPYQSGDTKGYLLSLKDQMTLYHLPNLVEAGIHSFKIEGRMKNPEYVYTTTKMYRKYRDLALSGKPYVVEDEDIARMNQVFSRGQTSEGYYFMRKSGNMIYPEQPKTSKLTNAKTLSELSFVRDLPVKEIKINLQFSAKINEPMKLKGEFVDDYQFLPEANKNFGMVEVAQKKAVTVADIEKPLMQIGDTRFKIVQLDIQLDQGIFIPLSHIKELRRQVIQEMEALVLAYQKEEAKLINKNSLEIVSNHKIKLPKEYSAISYSTPLVSVLVRTSTQLELFLSSPIDRIYIEWSFISSENIRSLLKCVDDKDLQNKQLFLAMPTILRNSEWEKFFNDFNYLQKFFSSKDVELGVLVRTADYLDNIHNANIPMVLDHSINIWNQMSYQYYQEKYQPVDICLSNEINYFSRSKLGAFEMVVYGKLATMQTANCLANVHGNGQNRQTNPMCKVGAVETLDYIIDRKGSSLGYHRNCKTCSNTLFNSVPLYVADQQVDFSHCLRWELLDESQEQLSMIMDLIYRVKNNQPMDYNPFDSFTRGHFNKGVE